MAAVTALTGILRGYDGVPESLVPPPPESLALWVYVIFRSRLHAFLRAAGVDFETTSGFRNPARNEAVGGVENSAHLHGLAEDVVIRGPVPRDLAAAWEEYSGGLAVDEGDHWHFNAPRAWGWSAIRWLFVAVIVLVFSVVLFLQGALDGRSAA